MKYMVMVVGLMCSLGTVWGAAVELDIVKQVEEQLGIPTCREELDKEILGALYQKNGVSSPMLLDHLVEKSFFLEWFLYYGSHLTPENFYNDSFDEAVRYTFRYAQGFFFITPEHPALFFEEKGRRSFDVCSGEVCIVPQAGGFIVKKAFGTRKAHQWSWSVSHTVIMQVHARYEYYAALLAEHGDTEWPAVVALVRKMLYTDDAPNEMYLWSLSQGLDADPERVKHMADKPVYYRWPHPSERSTVVSDDDDSSDDEVWRAIEQGGFRGVEI